MTVRTRFAPSPTGYLHIGGLRTALFCWLYARRHAGKFVLRIEDTDLERSTPEAVQQILDGMTWAGLDADEGPFLQTRRFDRYREVIDRLLAEGSAYRCYCTREELAQLRADQTARGEKPRYDGRWRDRSDSRPEVAPVVRFKNPSTGEVTVNDVVHGPVVFRNAELDDLIIARSDGSPTYNFCVVVDDMDMEITHVIRGDDHLNNTPRQMNMLLALGRTPPIYAHLPMILGSDGGKLSKRHGAVSVLQYRDDGFLPEAVLNHLVRLGWSHGDQEVFSLEEMIAQFDIIGINKSAAAFDLDKLKWLNQQHMKSAPLGQLGRRLAWYLAREGVEVAETDRRLPLIAEVQRDRARTLQEMAANSVFFFKAPQSYDGKGVVKHVTDEIRALLPMLAEELARLTSWAAPQIHSLLTDFAAARNSTLGKLAQPIRLAVSGGSVSPPVDATLAILGREETMSRLALAMKRWSAAGQAVSANAPEPGSRS